MTALYDSLPILMQVVNICNMIIVHDKLFEHFSVAACTFYVNMILIRRWKTT